AAARVRHPRPALPVAGAAPVGPAETAIAEMWQELLGVDGIGRHDEFFALGGNSLVGVSLLARLRRAFEVEVPLRALLSEPTIAALGVVVEDLLLARVEALSADEVAAEGGAR